MPIETGSGRFGIYLMVYTHILIFNIYLHAKYHLPRAINKDFRLPYVLHK